MRIKSILASMLAIATLASCAKVDGTDNPAVDDGAKSFLSLTVSTPYGTGTRTSGENDATTGESTITDLYVITFDPNQMVVQLNATQPYAYLPSTMLEIASGVPPTTTTNSFAISNDAKYALLIANPGVELLNVLNTQLVPGMTFAELNAAVSIAFQRNTVQRPESLVGEQRTLTGAKESAVETSNYSYFTMINSDGLIDISGNMKQIDGTTIKTEAEAIAAAKNSPVSASIERLTAKIQVASSGSSIFSNGTGALLTNFWTLDVLNSQFFPYAEKVQMNKDNHVPTTPPYSYLSAFYTTDPNYISDEAHIGLAYNNLAKNDWLEPQTTWLASGKVDYAIENTMEPAAMLYKNVTRVVIKANYWPFTGWYGGVTKTDGDWFRYGGVNFASIEKVIEYLKTLANVDDVTGVITYSGSNASIMNFIAACESFVTAINDRLTETYNFGQLTTEILARIEKNGGEIVKDPEGCIRWYQGGLNYYYYEIRHDNEQLKDGVLGENEYGVVRNNWYSLTLTSISGHGTPWYPTVNPEPNIYPETDGDPDTDPNYPDPKPDPKDPYDPTPDPEDPVETAASYIAFKVEVSRWIKWTNAIEL